MTHPSSPADPGTGLISRRSVLAAAIWGAGGIIALSNGGWYSANAAALPMNNPAPMTFMAVSRLLTSHVLDDSLADRAWQAITSRESEFSNRFAALSNAIEQAGLRSMTQWPRSSIAQDIDLKATALAIVSAWYLGRVGEMQERSADGPAFITYAGALMWRPTLDVTVIPSYARGKPGFWKNKPLPSA